MSSTFLGPTNTSTKTLIPYMSVVAVKELVASILKGYPNFVQYPLGSIADSIRGVLCAVSHLEMCYIA